MKVVTADEMREIDRRAIEEYGIPGVVLMENAGRGAADAIEEFMTENDLDRPLIIAGKGNNGGDGFVVARHLANRGVECAVCLIGKKEDVRGDARVNLDAAENMGLEIREITDSLDPLAEELMACDVIIDAILGTGLDKDVKGVYMEIIEAVNMSDLPVVSLDIPSGLHATSGRPLGIAVEADLTVTFCLPKTGLLVYPGADYAGDIVLTDIGAPRLLLEDESLKTSIVAEEDIQEIILPRPADSHKGTYGHLLVIAGSTGKSGAAVMAAEAAMRSGSGLVTVAAPASINDILEIKLTEAMTESLHDGGRGTIGVEAIEKVVELMNGKNSLIIGPGISRSTETGAMIKALMGKIEVPAVLDADALWHLAEDMELLKDCGAPLVLTPHPGEMSKLLGITTKEVQEDRIGISRKFAMEYGCHLILKGARTVIAAPDGSVYINSTGNPGMASGGTGDVLCGIIASLMGQRYAPLDASIAGVYIHGYAGDIVAEEKGEAGLIASDIIAKVPEALKTFSL